MKNYLVSCSKGQMKVQQMAFVLVALVIFFVIIGLFFLSISLSSLKGSAEDIREKEVLESIKRVTSIPEFAWTIDDCASCIDMDKAMAFKGRASYVGFWDYSLLRIERVYPIESGGECTLYNYPECDALTLINKSIIPDSKSAFVSLCRYESEEGYYKCELGKVIIAGEAI